MTSETLRHRHVEIPPAVLCPHCPIVDRPDADFSPGRGRACRIWADRACEFPSD